MGLHADWVGQALVGIDGWCRTPYAPGLNLRYAYGFETHFTPIPLLSSTSLLGFTTTQISSGTLTDQGQAGGVLSITNTTDGQGVQCQADGIWFAPAAGKFCWVEFGIKGITDADDCDWMVGLASSDTNIFSTDPTNLVVFRGDDGDANIDFQVRAGGTGSAADTTYDTADATAVTLGFFINGVTNVTGYVNSVALTAVTSNIPTSAMRLTFGALGGGTTNPNHFGLDWIRFLATV
jgi:hypothetical protein